MERLSKELRDYLYEISPHSGVKHYLHNRVEHLSYEDARHEQSMMFGLERKGMIDVPYRYFPINYTIKPSVSKPNPGTTMQLDDGEITILSFPTMFDLTSDGRNYKKEARKRIAAWFAGVVLTAILSGFFAWVFTAVVQR